MEWEGEAGWFVGRDCSDPTSYIMPLLTNYGYYLYQLADGGTGATTDCPEDMFCWGDGVTAPQRCPDGYKCNIRTPHEFPNLKPKDGYFQNWLEGQVLNADCDLCLNSNEFGDVYEVEYDGARSVSTYSAVEGDPQETDEAVRSRPR